MSAALCPQPERWHRRCRCAASGPAAGDLVPLPDPVLGGEPRLHRGRLDALLPRDLRHAMSIGISLDLGVMTRTGRERSARRQRTTPRRAGIGSFSMIAANAFRWTSTNRRASPGALRSIRPSGPSALNRSTQSRTICKPTCRRAQLRCGCHRHRSLPIPTDDLPALLLRSSCQAERVIAGCVQRRRATPHRAAPSAFAHRPHQVCRKRRFGSSLYSASPLSPQSPGEMSLQAYSSQDQGYYDCRRRRRKPLG
jgi:hypothetical protein